MKMRLVAVVFLSLLCLLTACGRKGSPKPPEETAPAVVRFFSARGTVDSIVLSWRAPLEDASGDELLDLAGFVVKRNEFLRGRRARFLTVAELELNEEAEPPSAKGREAESFEFVDDSVEPGKRYDYVVLAVNEDGVEGGAANLLRVTFVGESSRVESFEQQSDEKKSDDSTDSISN